MDDFVDIAEIAARLGSFAPKNLIRACESGEIPAREIGGEWLVQRKWLIEVEARLNATVAQAAASAAPATSREEPRVQSLEERRRRKAANHFLKRISLQLAELKAELARIDDRLNGLDIRTRSLAQPPAEYHEDARPAPLLRKTENCTGSCRLE
jgi:hypothetical protein